MIKSVIKYFNLHMIGKLQTIKVKFAVKIFDYIHSLTLIATKNLRGTKKIQKNMCYLFKLILERKNKKGILIED